MRSDTPARFLLASAALCLSDAFRLAPSPRRFRGGGTAAAATTRPAGDGGDDDRRDGRTVSRRSAIAIAAPLLLPPLAAPARPGTNGLVLRTAPSSGLRWADAVVGTGEAPSPGSIASIDYSMASTAGRFPLIYSTKNGDEPYRWRLGDGSTIGGIERAVLGDPGEGIPPMRPGGIRRVIVPNALGYNALIGRDDENNAVAARPGAASGNQRCRAGSEGSLGPIPPRDAPDGAYQRWYQFYCNPRIPYQPDLVLDIKLYGKRGATPAAVAPR
mmetsp:Transcript_4928/g.11750  ORF Transcript_4928/g.11750 Transcript_4928/m.11750 type:complete len:272 (-) Transcript_4928:335-1150(-)